MRLCEATIPDVPSAVGCTGVAYSFGYSARWPSIARRNFSSASGSGIVRIHVIGSYRFEGEPPTKQQDIDRRPESDDADTERGLQGVVPGEKREQEDHQSEKQDGGDGIPPGPI